MGRDYPTLEITPEYGSDVSMELMSRHHFEVQPAGIDSSDLDLIPGSARPDDRWQARWLEETPVTLGGTEGKVVHARQRLARSAGRCFK
jgi:hypothetical protein